MLLPPFSLTLISLLLATNVTISVTECRPILNQIKIKRVNISVTNAYLIIHIFLDDLAVFRRVLFSRTILEKS